MLSAGIGVFSPKSPKRFYKPQAGQLFRGLMCLEWLNGLALTQDSRQGNRSAIPTYLASFSAHCGDQGWIIYIHGIQSTAFNPRHECRCKFCVWFHIHPLFRCLAAPSSEPIVRACSYQAINCGLSLRGWMHVPQLQSLQYH